jgi:hypothetical protein
MKRRFCWSVVSTSEADKFAADDFVGEDIRRSDHWPM